MPKENKFKFGDWIVSIEILGLGLEREIYLEFINLKSKSSISLNSFSPYTHIVDTINGSHIVIGDEEHNLDR